MYSRPTAHLLHFGENLLFVAAGINDRGLLRFFAGDDITANRHGTDYHLFYEHIFTVY